MLTKRQLQDAAECAIIDCADCSIQCINTIEATRRSAQTALAYREMLERLEWHNRHSQGESYCPVCFYHKSHGYANDCELAALLKESEVEEGWQSTERSQ